MAIYKLIPALKDYIWGGTNLKKYRKTDLDIISESWELSFHQDGLSKIEIDNKEYKNVLVGLSMNNISIDGIDCILNNKLLEDEQW